MGGSGEQRLVDEVFPVSSELALVDHLGRERMPAAAVTHDNSVRAHFGARRRAELHCRQRDPAERCHEAETGDVVVGHNVRGHRGAIGSGEPDALRLCNEIADGEHEPVWANDDAATDALHAKVVSRKCVVRHLGAEQHDGAKNSLEVEGQRARRGLQLVGESPVCLCLLSHGAKTTCSARRSPYHEG